MDKNKSLKIASVILGIIALAHLLRAVLGWKVAIENFNIPVYFSYVVFVISGFLSWLMYSASKK